MRLISIRFNTAILVIIVAAFSFIGCGGRLVSDKGNKVTQKNFMVLLKDGNQQGVWKTNDLAIKYQYEITSGTLNISGTSELIGGISIGFQWMTRVEVYLLFLDVQGIVTENILIYSSGLRQTMDAIPMVFESKIPIPEGCRTISFAYNGELKGAGTLDQSTFNLEFSPAKK
jgi:hypothetical protein